MVRQRFEKFEMKYGYYLPDEYKKFIYKFGGDSQFGSCRFEYPENIIANILRIPGKMDFRLIPFGDIGNGDYYCFYRYGMSRDDYFIGIYLHETSNFVILSSDFKSFLYRCMLDDYFASISHNDELSFNENIEATEESLYRCNVLSKEYGFNLDEAKKYKSEFDYHSLMIKKDDKAMQSLCFLGKYYLEKGQYKLGIKYINKAIKTYRKYLAPYYILGRYLLLMEGDVDGYRYLKSALKSSLVLTGYSYWQEDYIDIPDDVHREVALFVDDMLDEKDILESKFIKGNDPYNSELRKQIAQEYYRVGKYKEALDECSNALFCNEEDEETLFLAHKIANDLGEVYLTKIIEQDIKKIK
ncbi:MAG: SMI1/KNR4 family protein [Clostridiales bacterium]|nr:SMI1/KNR4 family protein [Clostridiales bacterium]